MPRRRKSRRQLGQIVNGTTYRDSTPERVVQILEAAHGNPNFAWKKGDVDRNERICLTYGDPNTGRAIDPPSCGVVRRAKTSAPDSPIWTMLVPTVRSKGGKYIHDDHIVRITRARKPTGKNNYDLVLYEHPKFHDPAGDKRAAIEAIAKDADKESRAARRDRDYAKADALKKKAAEIRKQRNLGRRRRQKARR